MVWVYLRGSFTERIVDGPQLTAGGEFILGSEFSEGGVVIGDRSFGPGVETWIFTEGEGVISSEFLVSNCELGGVTPEV